MKEEARRAKSLMLSLADNFSNTIPIYIYLFLYRELFDYGKKFSVVPFELKGNETIVKYSYDENFKKVFITSFYSGLIKNVEMKNKNFIVLPLFTYENDDLKAEIVYSPFGPEKDEPPCLLSLRTPEGNELKVKNTKVFDIPDNSLQFNIYLNNEKIQSEYLNINCQTFVSLIEFGLIKNDVFQTVKCEYQIYYLPALIDKGYQVLEKNTNKDVVFEVKNLRIQ